MGVLDLDKAIKRILEKQTVEGLFPTYRTRTGTELVETATTEIKNIGIHTFVLEKLVELCPTDPVISVAFQRGANYLIKDAVEYNGVPVWRWLKNPGHEDYMYPPDYDDTTRARCVIELAKSRMKVDAKFLDFPFESLLEEGFSPAGGIYIFMGDKKRTNDRIDPLVNANILYSLIAHLQNKDLDFQKSNVAERISDYLTKVIHSEDYFNHEFEDISRCYISHNLFAYIVSAIQSRAQIFGKKTLEIVRQKIEEQQGQYSNPLESALATLLLIRLEGSEKLIGKGLGYIQDMGKDSGLWNAAPFYEHKRLNHVFGAAAATSVFCLEALKVGGRI